MPTINRQKFIKFLAQYKCTAELFIHLISRYSNALDVDLIEQHTNQWDWDRLSGNKSLSWSEELLERYKDKWDWESLIKNQSLPWSESFIERYKDKWTWESLSKNESLPWSEGLIGRYEGCWDWGSLHHNKGVIKFFNNWTKQEISLAFERIRWGQ
jgi:hypothetical protein